MSKKLSEKIKDLIMTHITNPASVGYGKTWDWFEKHSHFGEFYRGAVELEQRIAELEERLRWKHLNELPKENREVLAKTKTNVILIIETQQIEEFNYDEEEHYGYGVIEYFMELPRGEG